jgi:hypothetical protein
MRVIDAARAQRAREIYDTALNPPPVILSPEEEAAWIELEEKGYDFEFDRKDCGVKHSVTPHKRSAYADLPMRGITYGQGTSCGTTPVMKRRAIALWPELTIGGRRKETPTLVKKSSPHPDSYGTSFPLRGMGLEGENPVRKWTLTVAEKHSLAARPLHYTRAAA